MNKTKFGKQFGRSVILLLIYFTGPLQSHAQNLTREIVVRGTVKDTSGPLIGVTVRVKGTPVIVLTDKDGKYIIKVPEEMQHLYSQMSVTLLTNIRWVRTG
ncbi:carboxypeptidase-like regulatory domain-containing protein [Flavitalea sp.]|nr:carboxypeptidase-like regulatory domain-containing protein [Flavitalea sp.]